MPKCAAEHLQRQIACGSKGVDQVIQCLSHVDSERAQAWKLEDETKVKLEAKGVECSYLFLLLVY